MIWPIYLLSLLYFISFTFTELNETIDGLKPKKAPGLDKISKPMLIELSQTAIRSTLLIFNAII